MLGSTPRCSAVLGGARRCTARCLDGGWRSLVVVRAVVCVRWCSAAAETAAVGPLVVAGSVKLYAGSPGGILSFDFCKSELCRCMVSSKSPVLCSPCSLPDLLYTAFHTSSEIYRGAAYRSIGIGLWYKQLRRSRDTTSTQRNTYISRPPFRRAKTAGGRNAGRRKAGRRQKLTAV